MTLTIGLDVGGTNVRGAVVDAAGVVVHERRLDSPATWKEMADAMTEVIADLRALAPETTAVGVGAAGLVDRDGQIAYSPNIPAFRDAPVRATLGERLDLPVIVDNDANVAAFGEVSHGAARGYADALMVTLGTGIGGGIVVGGEVLRGAHGYAGEIGHFTIERNGPMCACGHRGHWEAMASGNALGRMAREVAAGGGAQSVLARAHGSIDAIVGEHVGEAAIDGEPDALAILDEYADLVGVGLGALVNVLDPGVIVIGGGLVVLGDLLLDRVHGAFIRNVEAGSKRATAPVVAAVLGADAGVIGAAALARTLSV